MKYGTSSCISIGIDRGDIILHMVSLTFLTLFEHTSVEGYIMDQYCINLGYLLDNPSVVTLENPGAHSLHWYVGDQL